MTFDTTAVIQGTLLLLRLVTDLNIIHVMLELDTFRIQEQWCHGGIQLDFKEKADILWQKFPQI